MGEVETLHWRKIDYYFLLVENEARGSCDSTMSARYNYVVRETLGQHTFTYNQLRT